MFSYTLILESCQAFRHTFSSSSQGICKHCKKEQGNALLTVLEKNLVSEAGVGGSG